MFYESLRAALGGKFLVSHQDRDILPAINIVISEVVLHCTFLA